MKTIQGVTLACLLVFVIILGITSAESGTEYDPQYGQRNITIGRRRSNDKLLYNERQIGEKKFLQVVSKDFIFPSNSTTGNTGSFYVITYLVVQDMYNSKHSGYAYLTSVGVGQTFVGLHLESQRNYGFDFNIKIYGFEFY